MVVQSQKSLQSFNMSKFIFPFLILFSTILKGQIIVLGGYISIEKTSPDPLDFTNNLSAHILFERGSEIPDSVNFNYGLMKNKSGNLTAVKFICDSTREVEYIAKDCSFDFATTIVPVRVTTFKKAHFAGINVFDSTQFELYYQNEVRSNWQVLKGFSPELIHHNPNEELHINLFWDSLVTETILFSMSDVLSDPWYLNGLYIHPATGDIVWRNTPQHGKYSSYFYIESPFSSYDSPRLNYTLAIDSMIKSHFVYDATKSDSIGLIAISAPLLDTFRFSFYYVDPDADSVIPEFHSTLTRFHLNSPDVKCHQSNDTTFVEFNLIASKEIYMRLPGSMSFLFRSYKQGRTCIKRCFSFYIKGQKSMDGLLEETTINKRSIYPNPSNSFVNIDLSSTFNYDIYNYSGMILLSGSAHKQIDIRSLPTGLYSLKITTDAESLQVIKLLKTQ